MKTMAMTKPGTSGRPRNRLDREAVLRTALAQADESGLDALSMRKLAEALAFAPMALYRHVASRDDLIDGMVDLVFSEIHLPVPRPDWRTEQRRRAVSVRDVLARHRWAIGLMESRTHPGPANLRHHDAVLGSLRAGGFDLIGAAHAYSAIDSYVYGFALTKMNLPFESGDDVAGMAESMLEPFTPGAYPNLVEFIEGVAMQPGYDYAHEFGNGLDIVLDGLERAHAREEQGTGGPG
jgi:AcrR family transcriptional regulator